MRGGGRTHRQETPRAHKRAGSLKGEILTVTQFEKITQSPETLGAFLAALPVIDGPWDTEFQARFCAGCAAENCDACPNQRFRNNPSWWLNLEAGGGCEDRYAVVVTYHNGAKTGAVIEAESAAGAWGELLSLFNPQIIASAEVLRILTPERGAKNERRLFRT